MISLTNYDFQGSGEHRSVAIKLTHIYIYMDELPEGYYIPIYTYIAYLWFTMINHD